MTTIDLTQSEADELLALEKHCVDDTQWLFPDVGSLLTMPLTSADEREAFLLDVSRGRISLERIKYQNRARIAVVLARIDIGGPPHRNPDGQEVPCPHIHCYREGYGDKWASPLCIAQFGDPSDLWQTLHDFMRYCNIVQPPRIERGLFT